jgi:hypothetical protein
LHYPTEFAVDASGIYWISPDLDQIFTCPLTGCGGAGPTTVVTGLGPTPRFIRLDTGFVYWVSDAPVDATISANITRVAKP